VAVEETPELVWPLNVQIYDRMRRQDAQVISVIRAVTLPILRTPWRIDPNGARAEVVELVADDLGLPVGGRVPVRGADAGPVLLVGAPAVGPLMETFGQLLRAGVPHRRRRRARLRKCLPSPDDHLK
jgi:hypothetical protein